MNTASQNDLPLAGIRVIEFSHMVMGPAAGLVLADLGADVIRVEPTSGDKTRTLRGSGAGYFAMYNRNKKSVALDISKPGGLDAAKKLIASADVFVENLRPGSLERQGLGYEAMRALSPGLVYAAISGFGRMPGYTGPYSDRPAFDIVAEAMSGVMHLVGYDDKPPSWTIYGMADIHTGLCTAFGIMQALFMRTRTGEGQFVDSSMYDNLLALNEGMVTVHSVAGQSPHRGRPRNIYPRGAYETRDGYIALNIPDERQWARLAGVIGHPELTDDPRSNSAAARVENRNFVDPLIEGWLKTCTRAEAVTALNDAGIPCGPVNTAEDVFACPQVAARGALMEIDDPEVGAFRFARTPLHMGAAPDLPAKPPPSLGVHTRAVFEGLGYSDPELQTLADAGAVAFAD